jgi:O-antigen ligase
MARRQVSPRANWPLILIAIMTIVILAQLVPLPPDIWKRLPGHAIVANGYWAAEISAPWLPISLTPSATWDALLGLVPPVALFIATVTLDVGERRWLAAGVVVVVLTSVGLGMLQLAGGEESGLRIYAITNPKSAVGFFANRNHLAALLASGLPLTGYLAARWAGRGSWRILFWASAGLGVAVVIAVGVFATGSRAGLLLTLIGAVGAVMVVLRAWATAPGPRWRFAALVAPAVLALAAGGLVGLATDPGLERAVMARSGPELRLSLNPEVAKAGLAFAPLGSGVGSFAPVYQMFEPVESMGPAFVNHAHDDFIEVWLEAGVAGVALVLAFLAWWVSATWSFVQDRRGHGAALSLAGSLIVGMLLIHSLVDYPLRTPALAVLFAFACGLIVPAKNSAHSEAGSERG